VKYRSFGNPVVNRFPIPGLKVTCGTIFDDEELRTAHINDSLLIKVRKKVFQTQQRQGLRYPVLNLEGHHRPCDFKLHGAFIEERLSLAQQRAIVTCVAGRKRNTATE